MEQEFIKCGRFPLYFLDTYALIYDASAREWVPFRLWPAQAETLRAMHNNPLTIILKARQLGLTWLVLGYVLWHLVFHPASTALLFSKRDDEASDLLSFRLRGMHGHLPAWMQAKSIGSDNVHEWELKNGSRAMAFPTTAGDSYTATIAVVDEADLVPHFSKLMGAVKPTIDNGGRMILLSRSDKSQPMSEFKRIYCAAKQGLVPWKPMFLPWHVHPNRDAAWYERQKADIMHRTGSLDDLHEQYPATDVEALAPRTLDKRIAPAWLQQCYQEQRPLTTLPSDCPAIPGLEVYRLPEAGRSYVIGVDPAEGNPTSDDSALTVLDRESREEVATLAGKFQPATIAAHADAIGTWFNKAGVMVERNNHGHAVLLWLKDNSRLRRLDGIDGNPGWLSNTRGKAVMYDATADAFREGDTILHSFATYAQLASIEGTSLRAPDGQNDDRADSYALAICGACYGKPTKYEPSFAGPPRPQLAGIRVR